MQHETNVTVEQHRTANKPLSSQIARHCLLTRARQISRVPTSVYDDAMRPFGSVAPQFSLLVPAMAAAARSRSPEKARRCSRTPRARGRLHNATRRACPVKTPPMNS